MSETGMKPSGENEEQAPGPKPSVTRSALSLGLIALIATALLAWVHQLTEPRIAAREREQLLEQLRQVIPAEQFNNAMQDDYITVRDESAFPGGQAVRVFRARLNGEDAAVVMKFRANDGYNGRIDLLLGINHEGSITGVRVSGKEGSRVAFPSSSRA
jgi:electron transport complex protein RnfG